MLRALSEAGIRPDLVVGTSVGAINGAFVAADPLGAAARLGHVAGRRTAAGLQREAVGAGGPAGAFGHPPALAGAAAPPAGRRAARRRLRRPEAAVPVRGGRDRERERALVQQRAGRSGGHGVVRGAGAAAAGRDRRTRTTSTAAWSTRSRSAGPIALGASTVYVLQVGRIESALEVPTRPWEVALVAFEIARRHRFHEEISSLPDNIRVHVLPTGGDRLPPGMAQFRYRNRARVRQSIERAYTASASYLAALTSPLPGLPVRGRPPEGRGALLPPRFVRRLVVAPVVIVVALGLIVLSPLLVVLALLFGLAGLLRAGRMRNLRLVSFVMVGLTTELVTLLILLGLWIASGFGGRLHTEPYQNRHYAVVRWFLDALFRGAERTYGLRVEVEEPDLTGEELLARASTAGHRAVQARRTWRLVPAYPSAAERLRAAAAGGDEGQPAVRSQPGHPGQPAAQRIHQAPGDRGEHLHRPDRAAGPQPRSGRGAGDLPRGRQLDPEPVAPRHPAAGARRPPRPGRAGPGYAQPAPAAAGRSPGRHRRLPGSRRDLRGARRAGHRSCPSATYGGGSRSTRSSGPGGGGCCPSRCRRTPTTRRRCSGCTSGGSRSTPGSPRTGRAALRFPRRKRCAERSVTYWSPVRTDVIRWVLKPSQCIRPT